jgi:conjugative relaxase-like TrwC/TraI family protein
MFRTTKISSVEYYLADGTLARERGGIDAGERDELLYYSPDSGAGESVGSWYSGAERSGNTAVPFALVRDGEEVDPREFRTLSSGFDPRTGEQLTNAKGAAAHDMTFSVPKSVSCLFAAGDDAERARLIAVQEAAVRSAIDYMQTHGMIVYQTSERGPDGSRRYRLEEAQDFAVALYTHTTNRAGDPQLHTHAVAPNVVLAGHDEDGKPVWRTLNNMEMSRMSLLVGAIYRGALARGLEDMGYATERNEGREFEVVGVPDKVIDTFSTRRKEVLAELEAMGIDPSNTKAAEIAALNSRSAKQHGQFEEQKADWQRRLAGLGWSGQSVIAAAKSARFARDKGRSAETPEQRRQDMEAAAMERIAALMETEGVHEERHMRIAIAEAVQCMRATPGEVDGIYEGLQDSGKLKVVGIRSGYDALGRETKSVMVSTPEYIAAERSMILDARERKNERVFATPEAIERAIDKRRGLLSDDQAKAAVDAYVGGRLNDFIRGSGLASEQIQGLREVFAKDGMARDDAAAAIVQLRGISDEQIAAVRHALNKDGVAVVEGSAGAGKSFSLGAVAEAARECGLQVHALAPSWKAANVIRADTKTAAEYARAIQGFVLRLENGSTKLDAKTAIIVDEAGMVPVKDMSILLAHARKAGAKVILGGDTRQLSAVGAGASLELIAKECGSVRINEIRRQNVAWMKRASEDFAKGNTKKALAAYDEQGRIVWADDRAAAVQAVVAAWSKSAQRQEVDKDGKPKVITRLVVAPTNADCHEINAAVREEARRLGMLRGPDYMLEGITRGKSGAVQQQAFAEGDRVIFGETVSAGGATVNNSDMATVLRIVPNKDDPANPRITFRLDKDGGAEFTASWSELVGKRQPDDPPEARHPKIQAAHCVTVHASQGTTVTDAVVFNSVGMGREATYVGMTRHRENVEMVVDGGRVRAELEMQREAKAAKKIVMQQGSHGIDAPDEDDEPKCQAVKDALAEAVPPVSHAEIKAVVFAECDGAHNKANVSDFVADRDCWLSTGEIRGVEKSVPSPGQRIQSIIDAQERGPNYYLFTPGQVRQTPAPSNENARRLGVDLNQPITVEAPKPKEPEKAKSQEQAQPPATNPRSPFSTMDLPGKSGERAC